MLLKSTDIAMSKARHPSLLPRWQSIIKYSQVEKYHQILPGGKILSKSFLPIMSRPSSRCFLFEMEHIKLVCFSDKCLILNPDDKATQNFIYGLKMQFHCEVISSCEETNIDD